MNLTEIFSQHYFHELERKDNLNNALTIPIGIVSIIFGALLIIVKEIENPYSIFEYVQIGCLGLTLFAVLFATGFICRTLMGYQYWMIPTMEVIQKYKIELKEYYEKLGKPPNEASLLANTDTVNYTSNLYIEYANINSVTNDKKSFVLFKTNFAILLAVFFLSISSAPYLIKIIKNPNSPQKVEITNLKELAVNITNATNQTPPPPTPVKPSPPPGRLIREHSEKPPKN